MFCCQVRVTSMTMSGPTICASLKAVPEASNRKCKAYLKIELDNAAKMIYIYTKAMDGDCKIGRATMWCK